MLSIAGCAAALLLAGVAAWGVGANFYAADVYGMTRASHQRFAAACLVFAGLFAASLLLPAAAVPLWGLFTVAAILYGASFLRGFGD